MTKIDKDKCDHLTATITTACTVGNCYCPHCENQIPLYTVFSNILATMRKDLRDVRRPPKRPKVCSHLKSWAASADIVVYCPSSTVWCMRCNMTVPLYKVVGPYVT